MTRYRNLEIEMCIYHYQSKRNLQLEIAVEFCNLKVEQVLHFFEVSHIIPSPPKKCVSLLSNLLVSNHPTLSNHL